MCKYNEFCACSIVLDAFLMVMFPVIAQNELLITMSSNAQRCGDFAMFFSVMVIAFLCLCCHYGDKSFEL